MSPLAQQPAQPQHQEYPPHYPTPAEHQTLGQHQSQPQQPQQPPGNKPEQEFSAGGITATIWKNNNVFDGRMVETKSVKFDKKYKDKDGKWKSTQYLLERDVPNALIVLAKAYEHIKLKIRNP